jgi:hypothetical protein
MRSRGSVALLGAATDPNKVRFAIFRLPVKLIKFHVLCLQDIAMEQSSAAALNNISMRGHRSEHFKIILGGLTAPPISPSLYE